jgi:uncharacterized lipoprotein
MKKVLALATALLLSACATVLTPERCASIDAAASTIEQIAASLEAAGVEPVRAHKLAVAVKTFQMTMQAACAQSNPPAGPAPLV